MKSILKTKWVGILAVSALTSLLAGCMPGVAEFGYSQNPVNIFYQMGTSLDQSSSEIEKNGADWMMLFSDRMICLYGDETGHAFLKKILGGKNISTRFDITTPKLKSTNASKLVGYADAGAIMKVTSGESYEVDVHEKSTGKKVMRSRVNCFKGDHAAFCAIANLQLVGLPNRSNPVCNDLPVETL